MTKYFLKSIILLLIIVFVTSCKRDDNSLSYEEKVEKLTSDFKEQKKDLLSKIIVEKVSDNLFSKEKLNELNKLENNYENELNDLNKNLIENRYIKPFDIKKTTVLNVADYSLKVGLNIENRTVFNIIVKEITSLLIKASVLAFIVLLLSRFVNYILFKDLFKLLFTHPIVLIIFIAISYFLSPAKLLGLTSTALENETEKIVSFDLKNTSDEINEIKFENASKIEK